MSDKEFSSGRNMEKVFLYMLHAAFVEIRASESLIAAKKFADVFHNVPMMLANRPKQTDGEAIFAELLERGRRNGLEAYLQDLRKKAEERVGNL